MALTLTYDFANGDALDADKVQTNMEEIEAKFGSIGSTDLSNSAVTAAKIASEAVTTAKLDQTNGQEAVTTATIRDSAVTAAKIAADAVDSAEINDGAVDWAHLANETPNVWYTQYTGNGGATQNITGCPFQPTLAIVVPLETYAGLTIALKHSSMSGTNAIMLTSGTVAGAYITALNADGITVGVTCNTNNLSALAICFRTK